MAAHPEQLLRHIRRLASRPTPESDSDAELLRRFVRSHEEGAFAALVARHGPMVHGVCRRVLRDVHDAEDATQATFLLLARKAAALRRPERVAAWLYGAARHLALRCRTAAARRQRREAATLHLARPTPSSPLDELTARELLAAVDEEVQRLPEAYRLPVILCCLEGHTQQEAARRLGWTPGSVKGRLERGRARLHARLARRGLALSAGLVAVELARGAGPMKLSASLTAATVQAALALVAGRGLTEAGVSVRVIRLVQGGLEGIAAVHLKLGVVLLLSASAVLAGTGALVCQVLAPKQAEARPEAGPPSAAPPDRPQPEARTGTDHYGDALPEGAVARLGAMRWRHVGEAGSSLVFSPDGKVLAARFRGEVLFWDAATGRELRRLPLAAAGPHPSFERAANWGAGPVFTPDGKRVAVQATTGEVSFWEVATGKCLRTLHLPPSVERTIDNRILALSPNGKVVAVTDGTGRVHLLEAATEKVLRQLDGQVGSLPSLTFSPDGKILAVGRDTRSPVIQLHDTATGKLLRNIADSGMLASRVAFSPDGRTLATGGPDRVVLWDAATGKEVGRLPAKAQQWFSILAFTPDGKALVWGVRGGNIHVWDLGMKRERKVLDCSGWFCESAALSPDGRTVAVDTVSSIIRLWDITTGKELFTEFQGHGGAVFSVAFTPDGKALVSAGGGSEDEELFSGRDSAQVYVWDTTTWRQTRRLKAAAVALSFTPDGRRPATAAYGKKVRVWDFATGAEAFQLQLPDTAEIRKPVFSRDGRLLISLDWTPDPKNKNLRGGGRLVVWRADGGKPIRQIPVPELNPQPSEVWFNPSSLAVTPDGRMAVVGDGEGVIHLYDLETGKQIQPLIGHTRYVDALDLSPDGRTLVSGSLDRGVRLWDLVTGQAIAVLTGHRREVTAVALSPDGRLVASAGGSLFDEREVTEPRHIRLWDVATGAEVAHFEGHQADVTALAFAPDGSALVSAMWDGTVLVWDLHSLPRLPSPAMPTGGMDALWNDLASADARKAHRAVWALAAAPERAVPFLGERLRPAAAVGRERVRRLIADLGSDRFAVREQAFRELAGLGSLIRSDLQQALRNRPSPEARKRLENLLADATGLAHSPGDRQAARAVQVLERIGTPAARRLLESLSRGAAEARQTREAKASLRHLAGRPTSLP